MKAIRSLVFVATLATLASCGKNTRSFTDAAAEAILAVPAAPPGGPVHGATTGGPVRGGTTGRTAPPAWTIAGTIRIDAALADKVSPTDVMYVMARPPGGAGMPVAVARIDGPTFPVSYTLAAGHGMGSPEEAAAQFEVSARISKSGTAGPAQPGDMEGRHAVPVPRGATGIDFTVDKAF